MPKTKPNVSIVLPVYNAQNTLLRAISSVQAQCFSDWEIIAVDDCSNDDSLNILNDMAASDHRIRAFSLDTNKGVGAARSLAIEMASGKYLAFLDSDDEWFSNKLSRQLSWMEQEGYEFTCTAYQRVRDGKIKKECRVFERRTRDQLMQNNSVANSTAILNRENLPDIQVPILRTRQDLAYWLRVLKHIKYVYGLNEVLMSYHMCRNSVTSNKMQAAIAQWRFYGDELHLPFGRKLWCFGHYAVNASKRNF